MPSRKTRDSPHPYLSGNFAPIHRVQPLTPCEYSGTLPEELAGGQYVRNGGNPLINGSLERDAHWFDGDGMLSGVAFSRHGEKGTFGQNSSTTLPGLETIGWYTGTNCEGEAGIIEEPGFGGEGLLSFFKEWTTAHPRVDPQTSELLLYHSTFAPPYVQYSVIPPTRKECAGALSVGGAEVLNAPVAGMHSAKMMHDFGVSRTHTIIMDLPLSLDPLNLAKNKPVVAYDPNGVSRFGDLAAPIPTDTTSKYEKEEEQCRLYYYEFQLSSEQSLNKSGSGEVSNIILNQWALCAVSFEFPTLNEAQSMSAAKYVYGCSVEGSSFGAALGRAVKIDSLVKVDVETLIQRGKSNTPNQITGCVDNREMSEIVASRDPEDPIKVFKMPPGWYAQESRFVPRSNGSSEDDGWLLSYVFDESQLDQGGECLESARSELWVIDAKTMAEVVAKVYLPQRVPYGLHGNWFSEEQILNQRPATRFRSVPPLEKEAQKTSPAWRLWLSIRHAIQSCLN
ncbi:hypothetical protein G7Y79_00004g013040 [Physcia stellaris]|nr:hypothetical protein G7Y79_00004g013040 [Physcia stellaris]